MKRKLLLISLAGFVIGAASAQAEVIVSEDFFYNQPTKTSGVGGGFNIQDYGGGHSVAGQWQGRWGSVGEGIIYGADDGEDLRYQAFTNGVASDNYLQRTFQMNVTDDTPIYFSGRIQSPNLTDPPARFGIASPGTENEIGWGFDGQSIYANLGTNIATMQGLDQVEEEYHTIVGQLALNVDGDSDQLTVWLDPVSQDDFVTATVAFGDVAASYADLALQVRLDGNPGGTPTLWDDVVLATTFEEALAVDVPRLTLRVDDNTGFAAIINGTDADVDLSYYEIVSSADSLDADALNGFEAQGLGGGTWQSNNSQEGRITETSLTAPLTLASGDSINLGQVFFVGAEADLVARVGTSNGLLNIANVAYGDITVSELPCDLDGDVDCDIDDINALMTGVANGSADPALDLDGNGTPAEATDVAAWLTSAGSELGFTGPVLLGDANLDGIVDAQDLNAVGQNWNSDAVKWSDGNFVGAGVDAADLNVVGINWRSSALAAAQSPVPEPNAGLLLLAGLFGVGAIGRRRSR